MMKRSSTSDFRRYESPNKISAAETGSSLAPNRPGSNGSMSHPSLNGDANALNLTMGAEKPNGATEGAPARRRELSIKEKTHFLSGTAERVLAWNRVFKQRCFFEVIATLVSIQESPVNLQNIILLKDKKGPILQVVHYVDHEMPEEDFAMGQTLRCVGYMTGVNTLTAVSVRKAAAEEITALKRHCHIGDFTISGFMNTENNR